MRIDLRGLIASPGGRIPFDFDTDLSEFGFEGVQKFLTPVRAVGEIENHAGLITMTGVISARLQCECARCLKVFSKDFRLEVTAYLTEELEDEDNEDYYLIEDGAADLEEIVRTAFVLNFDERLLCSEDCKGLCPKCGKNLNEGPCSCGGDRDPRLAVLGRLLDQE